MGRSTVANLIARGQSRNDYNNTGIDTPSKWVDAFNAALQDLVSDINLTETLTIPFVKGTREYDLPADFFEIRELWDGFNCKSTKRRYYDQQLFGFYPTLFEGYYVLFKGSGYVIDLYQYNADQTFQGIYVRYPALLSAGSVDTQRPEVPTVGEDALIDYAIMIALRNNNLLGEAKTVQQDYERGRKKIQDAAQRALLGGW